MSDTFYQRVEKLYAKSHELMDLIESGSEFGIFGTGKLARDSVMKIRDLGGNPSFIVDRQENNQYFLELPVRSLTSLGENNTSLLIASSWAQDVISDLRLANYKGDVFVIDPFVTVFERMTETDKQQLAELYTDLVDEDSRKILSSLIAFRCGEVEFLQVSQYPQYFSPLMRYSPSDIVIDGGAYIGDTIKSFDDQNVRVKAIHAFEPASENYISLIQYANQTKQLVESQQMGLWSSSTELSFSASETVGYGRKIEPAGEVLIPVISVDEYSALQDILPSVIKLDIEGAERFALQGAEKTIRSLKPKLAISVYHVHSDLWRLPVYIKQLNPNYQFSLGHHRTNWMETVLYGY